MKTIEMPFINVRDIVFYPGMEQSLFIGRDFTIKAIQHALKHNKGRVVAITQKNVENINPLRKSDMFSVGTICKIQQSVMTSDGVMKAHLKAEQRVTIGKVLERNNVRHVSGKVLAANSRTAKLGAVEKREVLELLVKWNPSLALDDEDTRLSELKKETDLESFLNVVFGIMHSRSAIARRNPKTIGTKTKKLPPAKLKAFNLGIRKRQVLLEENNHGRQIKLVKEILRAELS